MMTDRNHLSLALKTVGMCINAAGGDVPVYEQCEENSFSGVLRYYALEVNRLGGEVDVIDCDANSHAFYLVRIAQALMKVEGVSHVGELEAVVE